MVHSRRVLALLGAAAIAGAAAGCDIADDGPRTAQTRDVASFTKIDNRGSVDVRLHVGSPQRVRVHAGEKVIDDVATDVRDGTLRVSFDHSGFGGNGVSVDAWIPRLTGVIASGSGDVDATGVRTEALDVRVDGSADVRLDGSARRMQLVIDGSGDADLDDLAVRDATVALDGSGDADVRADRVDADVDGSGDLHRAR